MSDGGSLLCRSLLLIIHGVLAELLAPLIAKGNSFFSMSFSCSRPLARLPRSCTWFEIDKRCSDLFDLSLQPHMLPELS